MILKYNVTYNLYHAIFHIVSVTSRYVWLMRNFTHLHNSNYWTTAYLTTDKRRKKKEIKKKHKPKQEKYFIMSRQIFHCIIVFSFFFLLHFTPDACVSCIFLAKSAARKENGEFERGHELFSTWYFNGIPTEYTEKPRKKLVRHETRDKNSKSG